MEDIALLEAWRADDEAAGRTLVGRHFDSVYRFFLNKASSHAEDLVQETFLAVVESRDRVRDATAFRSYLFGVARRRLYRHWRDSGGANAEERPVEELSDQVTSVAEALARHQEQKLLLKALRRMPLRTQVLLELSYFEGLTDRELATLEEVPIGTLKSRLRKARADLEVVMATIDGGELLESTTQNFDDWVVSIRGRLEHARVATAAGP